MKGFLLNIHGDWFVRQEFGVNQVKNYPLNDKCIQGADEFGIEGEEVHFEVKGMFAPRTLNGIIQSAVIIYNSDGKN